MDVKELGVRHEGLVATAEAVRPRILTDTSKLCLLRSGRNVACGDSPPIHSMISQHWVMYRKGQVYVSDTALHITLQHPEDRDIPADQ